MDHSVEVLTTDQTTKQSIHNHLNYLTLSVTLHMPPKTSTSLSKPNIQSHFCIQVPRHLTPRKHVSPPPLRTTRPKNQLPRLLDAQVHSPHAPSVYFHLYHPISKHPPFTISNYPPYLLPTICSTNHVCAATSYTTHADLFTAMSVVAKRVGRDSQGDESIHEGEVKCLRKVYATM
jgi:hypothetical protein